MASGNYHYPSIRSCTHPALLVREATTGSDDPTESLSPIAPRSSPISPFSLAVFPFETPLSTLEKEIELLRAKFIRFSTRADTLSSPDLSYIVRKKEQLNSLLFSTSRKIEKLKESIDADEIPENTEHLTLLKTSLENITQASQLLFGMAETTLKWHEETPELTVSLPSRPSDTISAVAESGILESVHIGKGSFGTVALRFLKTTPIARKSTRECSGEAGKEAFKREVEILTKIQPHPHIIGVRAYSLIEGEEELLLDYHPQTLQELSEMGQIDGAQYKKIATDLVRAIAYLAAKRFAHNDIKPSNILISEDGNAILSDFGAVAPLGERAHIHTPHFAAPELSSGRGSHLTSDLYSLAKTLIRIHGISPPTLENFRERVSLTPQLDPEGKWSAFFERILEEDPERRPSHDEFSTFLREVESDC